MYLQDELDKFRDVEALLERRVISDEIDRFLVFAGFDTLGNPIVEYERTFRSLRKDISVANFVYVVSVSEIRVTVSKYDMATVDMDRVSYNEYELFVHQTSSLNAFVAALDDILYAEFNK